jgi:predicted CoA-binding protein
MNTNLLEKSSVIAIVGVSKDKNKYGRIVYNFLKKRNFEVYPINPKLDKIEKVKCYHKLEDLDKIPDIVVTVVPPKVTEEIVAQVKKINAKKVWMQPGSESELAIKFCKTNNIEVISNICIMVVAERL